jgi:hypothetical protein
LFSAYFIKSFDALDRMRTLFIRANKGPFKVHAEHRRAVFSTLPAFDFGQHVMVNCVGRGDQRGAEGGDTVREDTLGHGGHPFLRPVDVVREVDAESTCPKTEATNQRAQSGLVGGARAIYLQVNEARSDDGTFAVDLQVGRNLFVEEEALGILDAPIAHPQIVFDEGVVPQQSAVDELY